MSDLLLLAAVTALGASAVLLTLTLRLGSWTSFLLGSFVVGWTIVIVETTALSSLGEWTRSTMLGALAAGCVGAIALWIARGRPGGPTRAAAVAAARSALSDRLVAALAIAVSLGFVYLVALGIAVPPGQWDELLYHLPRMVLWIQQGSVAAIHDAPGANLDANPVAAEIPQALTLLVAGTDRYVAVFQLLCLPVASLAIYGIARRIGTGRPGALFGALLFATFPAIALQAPTGYNDLALAASLTIAAYFALGQSRVELVLAALAIALAVGTKVSGLLGLPALVLFVLVATRGRRRVEVAAACVVGGLVGSWWYAYNLVRDGSWDGALAEQYDQVPSRGLDDVLLRFQRYLTESIDLAGVVGNDRFVFPIVAVVVLVAGLVLRRYWVAVGAAAVVALAPWTTIGAHELLVRTFSRGWIVVGRSEVIGFFPGEPSTKSSTPEAWFGPALWLLVVPAVIVAAARTSGRTRVIALVACVGSPLLLTLTNAAAFTWDPGRGRFFLFGAALAATTFGLLLRVRFVAAGVATVAVITLMLSLVHFRGRVMGVELLAPVDDLVAWTAPRWEVQSAFSRDHPEVGEALRVVQEKVPPDATIAIGRSVQMPLYHVMGGGPWRRTVFVRPDGTVPSEADYVALPLFVELELDPSRWELLPGTGTGQAWRIYRRVD